MSTIAAPSPPAPPPPHKLLITVSDKCKYGSNAKSQLDECIWATEFSELQKACFLARVCSLQPPRNCEYHQIPSILQTGPTCGLTAISMLMDGRPDPQQLLAMAKEKGYTYLGEMFSATNLFHLICDTLTRRAATTGEDAVECELYHGQLNCAKVKADLIAGACLFVPYPFQKKTLIVKE